MIECLTQKVFSLENEIRTGRSQAATKQDVLKAIHDHKTTSAAQLANHLGVARATVYRRLQQISANEINEALNMVHEAELKPAQMQYEVFKKIPEINDFYETLARALYIKAERLRELCALVTSCVGLSWCWFSLCRLLCGFSLCTR